MITQDVIARLTSDPAYGETLGFDVPTRYAPETHATFNLIMAADSLITPVLFGMSGRTVWFCRFLSGLLFVTHSNTSDLELRQRLQIEAWTGAALLVLAYQGGVTHRFFERAYLFIGGLMMIGNALMTQIRPSGK
jgi:hypothetical protein